MEEQVEVLRVKMLESKVIESSPGSFVQYRMGELYLLPLATANQWIAEGTAIDPTTEEGGNS